MAERCPRCGKAKHAGACVFVKTKKSVIEQNTEKIKVKA